jgi:hypothetical protein
VVHIQWRCGPKVAQITLFWAAKTDTAPERRGAQIGGYLKRLTNRAW